MEQRQWLSIDCAVIDQMAVKHPYAVALFCILRRDCWGRDFILGDEVRETLGWSFQRLKSATAHLVKAGHIVVIDPAEPSYRLKGDTDIRRKITASKREKVMAKAEIAAEMKRLNLAYHFQVADVYRIRVRGYDDVKVAAALRECKAKGIEPQMPAPSLVQIRRVLGAQELPAQASPGP